MASVEALRRILKAEALEEFADGKVVLTDRQAPHGIERQSVTLLAGDTDLVAVRMDKFSHPSMLEGGWRKCDYAVFLEQQGQTEAVLIELKRSKANDSLSREQLRQSVPLVDYLATAAGVESSKDSDPADRVKLNVHYVVLYQRDGLLLDKQATHAAAVQAAGRLEYRGLTIRWRIGGSARLEELVPELMRETEG